MPAGETCQGQPPRLRALLCRWTAAELARRLHEEMPCWTHVAVGHTAGCSGKGHLQVCDTIAELASGTYEEVGWPELLPFIFQSVQSSEARLQESALLIFAQLAHHIMGTLRQYMATLHEVLTRTLQSPNHDVALASMRATAAFVQVRMQPQMCSRSHSRCRYAPHTSCQCRVQTWACFM